MLLYFSFSLQVPDAACWLSLLARAAGPLLQTLFKLGGHTQCWASEISCKSGNFEWGGNYRFVGQFLFVIRKKDGPWIVNWVFKGENGTASEVVENTRELIAQAKKEALSAETWSVFNSETFWKFEISKSSIYLNRSQRSIVCCLCTLHLILNGKNPEPTSSKLKKIEVYIGTDDILRFVLLWPQRSVVMHMKSSLDV